MDQAGRILLFCAATVHTKHRSGIHRVTIELARALSRVAPVDLVGWSEIDGQMRYLDAHEIDLLFRGDVPEQISASVRAHRVNARFLDEAQPGAQSWMLFPEISYHMDRGNETFARIISQCREYGLATAAIYYDAIPVTNPDYTAVRRPHVDYLVDLSRVDRILPISASAGQVLLELWGEASLTDDEKAALKANTRPVLLPEGEASEAAAGERTSILMIGTVEPRKRQVEVLEAINELRAEGGAMAKLSVDIVGALHPAVNDRFRAALAQNPNATYHKGIDDAAVERLYKRAVFSVFASNDEGYGLPIAESLVRGVPCLAANFGSMQEIAAPGGCLTVDVNDTAALKAGVKRLAEDAELRARLSEEIAQRSFRTWGDYAAEVLGHLDLPAADAGLKAGAQAAGALEIARIALSAQGVVSDRIDWGDTAPIAPAERADCVTAALWAGDGAGFAALKQGDRALFYEADVAAFADEASYQVALACCAEDEHPGLFAPRIVIEPDAKSRQARAEQEMRQEACQKVHRLKIAAEESRYMALARHFAGEGEPRRPVLSLVISTFNRSAFVNANARWLAEQVARLDGRVDLTVVDNVSTDDSWHALQALSGRPHVRLVQNPTNTGMLGNLNVCSTLPLARHVWVTGDDDFIKADVLDEIVAQLEAEPGLPLAFVNFAVYHRAAMGAQDTPRSLQQEGTPLAPDPSPDGMRKVCDIAGEHDNLFTAVYPIIFRSDILAACFNYPFTGIPFVDLVESVPTTKIILESYGQCPAYWTGAIGTVGNAHNSWSRHRPRWHSLLMPLVFEAARQAGVDERKLRPWADLHLGLYHEAIEIARDQEFAVHLEAPHDLEVGTRVFREPITVPEDLKQWSDATKSLWDGS